MRRHQDTAPRPVEPPLPEEITPELLDGDVRRELRGLPKDLADTVARHLVAIGELLDDDPAAALAHARFARFRASRIAVVREASGLAAYHAGEWAEALSELRASRRMGGAAHVPVMADAERALGRPERALEIARSPESADLPEEEQVELLIVTSGARRDLGQAGAAVVGLQTPALDVARTDPWTPRLFYAYAEALLADGRRDDAVAAFLNAAQADLEGETDAEERAALVSAGIDTPLELADDPEEDGPDDDDDDVADRTVDDAPAPDADADGAVEPGIDDEVRGEVDPEIDAEVAELSAVEPPDADDVPTAVEVDPIEVDPVEVAPAETVAARTEDERS